MERATLMIDAGYDELVEMAACALALAHAHDGEFGAAGSGVTEMFVRCSNQLKTVADTNDPSFELIADLTGDTDESVGEASRRLRAVVERELEGGAAAPWCLVLEWLSAAIDDEVARRPAIGGGTN